MLPLSIKARSNGFTLIEMLISLAIFALIGVSAYQVLASSALVSEREQWRTERMHELHKALRIMERDLRQVVDRPVRDELGSRDALQGSEEGPLEFTRAGNENPLRLARSELLRVMYLLREAEEDVEQQDSSQQQQTEDTLQLLRIISRMPDSSLEEPETEQLLLSAVESFTVRFMDADLAWHNAWPLSREEDDSNDDSDDDRDDDRDDTNRSGGDDVALPAAIELTLTSAVTGEVSRVISLRQ